MLRLIVAVTLLLSVPGTLFLADQIYRLIGSFHVVLAIHLGASLLGCALTALIALRHMPRLPRINRLLLVGTSAVLSVLMVLQFVWGLLDPGPNIGLGLITFVVVMSHPVLAFGLVMAAAAYGRSSPTHRSSQVRPLR